MNHLDVAFRQTCENIDLSPTEPASSRYAFAYGILRTYFEAFYDEMMRKNVLSDDDRVQIRTVLGRLKQLVQE